MDVPSGHVARPSDDQPPTISWLWVSASVGAGALLLAIFLGIVDPTLERLRVTGAVFGATLLLMGMVVGYGSPGSTMREPGLGGLVLVLIASAVLPMIGGQLPPIQAFVIGVLIAPLLAIAGAWTGEMLQGTYSDTSPGVQWLWVLVAIVVGFMAGLYAVFLAEALLGINYKGILAFFAASFMLTGFVVGYFSPGRTILEPAIATAGLIVLDTVFGVLQFGAWFPIGAVLLALVGGVVMSVTGATLGEAAQDIRTARPPEEGVPGGGLHARRRG